MLFICFSAFNEEHNIEKLLRRIAGCIGNSAPYRVIAFDDGSTDNTRVILEHCQLHFPLTFMSTDKNSGLGMGLNQLIQYVCNHGGDGDIVVFMDGDDTHDPFVIEHMSDALKRGADVVLASRYVPGSVVSGISWHRMALSRASSWFWRVMMPIPGVRDYTTGFRAYRVSLLKSALAGRGAPLITRPGFECQAEILFRLKGMMTHFTEVPIHLAYERKYSASKMRLLHTAINTLSLGFKLALEKRHA